MLNVVPFIEAGKTVQNIASDQDLHYLLIGFFY